MPILYLVNRKILKEQLKSRLASEIQAEWASKYPWDSLNRYISIRTYQEIEEQLKMGRTQQLDGELSQFGYVVYDECHYFRVDSTFNPATDRAFTYLMNRFDGRIQIFMSATLGDIHLYVDPKILTVTPNPYIRRRRMTRKFYYSYEGKTKYDYIQLHQIEGEDEIPALIEEKQSQEKWLIFVDSVKKGRELQEKIQNNPKLKKDEVIFIDAQYRNDLEGYEQVLELQQKASISKKVVIATSVLDNGVSFQDEDLNNIIIFADTWETFIQMVGRKRKDSKQVNLYIRLGIQFRENALIKIWTRL
jgi:superfamily II DNA or RNA helicase